MPKLKKQTEKARAAKFIKIYKKNGMSQTKTAKELKVTQPAVAAQLKRPAVAKALQQIIDANMKSAGITAIRVYTQLSNQLKAKSPFGEGENMYPDWNAQDKARKYALKLMGHLKEDTGPGPNGINLVQIFLPQVKPLKDVIDVDATT